MRHYKGIIFDLDGTLLNTIEDLSDSVNHVLTAFNHPEHSYDEYKLKIGKGFRNLIEVSFPEDCRDNSTIDSTLSMFLETYDKKYMDKTHPYDGIISMLEKIQENGILIGVNSNKRTDYTNALVKKHFPNTQFVEIFGERTGIPKKPDPCSALEIAELMGLSPEEILYVGDSKTDILTGQNAGMDTVGVLWGFRDQFELTQFRATYIVKHPKQIVQLI